MRIRVYEHLTASGDEDGSSMYREGRAMRDALIADLARIADVKVVEADAEFAIVIAPETGMILEAQSAAFRGSHVVIGSSREALALTRDKLALARHWQRHGVNTPHTMDAKDWPSTRFPAVLKPRDGAGSCDTYLCETEDSLSRTKLNDEFLAQDFIPGRPASIAFLVGPNQTVPLQPTFQSLSDDGRFQYLGGEVPIPENLAGRATRLGLWAIKTVPGLAGYVGVDLILGNADNGTEDFAIEINPRLTTSYIGLRELADGNLAEAMIRVYRGESQPEIRWKPGRVSFRADGQIESWN